MCDGQRVKAYHIFRGDSWYNASYFLFMYWNINQILAYQRNFNFINGTRSIGKTYTTQKFCLKKCIENGWQAAYIVRYASEKEEGALPLAFEKVLENEFKDYLWKLQNEKIQYKNENGEWIDIFICIALSESQKIKKRSFPFVKFIIFDEYMLERENNSKYVKGWKEPEIFLNIYHTIDREEDRVICFLLGNTTTFFNPYHMYPSFDIPSNIKPGEIWYNKFCLFQWAIPDEEMIEKKSKSKFNEMIGGSEYGRYARDGEYIEDSEEFVLSRPQSAKHLMNIKSNDTIYGIWFDRINGNVFIDDKYDPSCRFNFVLSKEELAEGFILGTKDFYLIKWLSQKFKNGFVKYTTLETKKKMERVIYYLS